MHEGGLDGAKNQNLTCRGSVLASKMQVGWFLGRWYPNGVGYIRFEVAGGCDSAICKGGLVEAKQANTEPQGLGSVYKILISVIYIYITTYLLSSCGMQVSESKEHRMYTRLAIFCCTCAYQQYHGYRLWYSHGSEFQTPYPYLHNPWPKHHGYSCTCAKP